MASYVRTEEETECFFFFICFFLTSNQRELFRNIAFILRETVMETQLRRPHVTFSSKPTLTVHCAAGQAGDQAGM